VASHKDDTPGAMSGGFNLIARDFDRAIAISRLSGIRGFIVQRARELSWTAAKLAKSEDPFPFTIQVRPTAALLGVDPKNVRQAVQDLESMRYFIPTDGGFLINKDYRKWLDADGNPALTADQAEWCDEIRTRQGRAKLPPPEGKITPKAGVELPSPEGKITPTTGAELPPPEGKNTPAKGVKLPSPHKRNAPASESESLGESKRETTPIPPSRGDDGRLPALKIHTAPEAESFRPIEGKPWIAKDHGELARWASAMVDPIWDFGPKLSLWETYEASWVQEAIEVGLANLKTPAKLSSYVSKLLRDWRAIGGPPRTPPKPGTAKPVALPPEPTRDADEIEAERLYDLRHRARMKAN
jgi:hypothetical protein